MSGERQDSREHIEALFTRSFGRAPSAAEIDKAQTFVAKLAAEHDVSEDNVPTDPRIWQDFAQALFNFKEFIYIR